MRYWPTVAFLAFLAVPPSPVAFAGESAASNPLQSITAPTIEALREAANQGNADAQYELALKYEFGDGIEKDLTEALFYYRAAAGKGHIGARAAFARLKSNINTFTPSPADTTDPQKATAPDSNEAAGNQTSPDELYKLGLRYENGDGVERSLGQAALFYRDAAEKGHIGARAALARLMTADKLRGLPRPQSSIVAPLPPALQGLGDAAEKGDAEAQYQLGNHFAQGKGVEKDIRRAVSYFAMAMRQGHAGAKDALIRIRTELRASRPQPTDAEIKEVQRLKTAAGNGDTEALFELGTRYASGNGVLKSERQAAVYFELASRRGHAKAKEELERVLKTMR